MKLYEQFNGPSQEHLDAAVDRLNPGTRDQYDNLQDIPDIREAYAHLTREQLEGRLSYEWKQGLEKRVINDAWFHQNRQDKREVAQAAAKEARGAIAVVQRINELARQGRKVVKLDDLAAVFKAEQEATYEEATNE